MTHGVPTALLGFPCPKCAVPQLEWVMDTWEMNMERTRIWVSVRNPRLCQVSRPGATTPDRRCMYVSIVRIHCRYDTTDRWCMYVSIVRIHCRYDTTARQCRYVSIVRIREVARYVYIYTYIIPARLIIYVSICTYIFTGDLNIYGYICTYLFESPGNIYVHIDTYIIESSSY